MDSDKVQYFCGGLSWTVYLRRLRLEGGMFWWITRSAVYVENMKKPLNTCLPGVA
ncbi:hypothetical protein HanIR_Chr13g0654811 [Helianthus annuus]|nr:hypothetical protein HanIR_Chr13g0654811 [Helianthus annuus]